MRGDCIVIQWTGVADVDVRIDEAGNEETIAAIYARGVGAGDETGSNLRDAAVANHDGDMRDGRRTFGGDESDVFDHDAIVDDLGRGGGRTGRVNGDRGFLAWRIREGIPDFFGALPGSSTG